MVAGFACRLLTAFVALLELHYHEKQAPTPTDALLFCASHPHQIFQMDIRLRNLNTNYTVFAITDAVFRQEIRRRYNTSLENLWLFGHVSRLGDASIFSQIKSRRWNKKWSLYVWALRHGIRNSMEAILACHRAAQTTEWHWQGGNFVWGITYFSHTPIDYVHVKIIVVQPFSHTILYSFFALIHTLDLARLVLPYYFCTLVKSDILVAPVHVGSVLFSSDLRCSHFYMKTVCECADCWEEQTDYLNEAAQQAENEICVMCHHGQSLSCCTCTLQNSRQPRIVTS